MSKRPDEIGLCSDCRYSRVIRSDRSSVFFLCRRSIEDARYPKYPRLPVRECVGYEPVLSDESPREACGDPDRVAPMARGPGSMVLPAAWQSRAWI